MSHAKWFLPNDETLRAEGPFTTDEILQRIVSGELSFVDFIWSQDFAEKRWYRIFEIEDFKKRMRPQPVTFLPQKLSRGQKSLAPNSEVFAERKGEYGIQNLYRRYPRAPLQAEAIIHDDNDILFTQTVDISERGLSVRSENISFQKGSEVTVTLRSPDILGTFSCRSVIIHSMENAKTVQMGFYFLSLNPNVRHRIANYVINQLHLNTPDQDAS